jgi:uncharacterized repeat protein (TIGR03803 family)
MSNIRWSKGHCAVFLFCAAMAVSSQAQTFTSLASFNGTDGSGPEFAPLIQGTDGDFYGTTAGGTGVSLYGTVFKITSGGVLTTLLSFDFTDGVTPYGGLVLATDGNFYGTTFGGGANHVGTVFKVTPGGTPTTLYNFCTHCADGANPYAGLVQAADGESYGTTKLGGTYNYGTVFKISSGGTLTTLHSFDHTAGGTDGAYPYAGLVQATDGDFYGTTLYGGTYNDGTVFKISPGGTLMTLWSFCSESQCADGGYPYAGLVQATDGNFYGTTADGGAVGKGTVFQITPGGTLTTIYSFGGCPTGCNPKTGLVQATDGNFYGTSAFGAYGGGTLFQITPEGTLTTLYSFCPQPPSCADGNGPDSTLLQATNGEIYGTTSSGGTKNDGTVFSLAVGLGPFVTTLPTSGTVGTTIRILGTNLTGTTSVSFNGTAAVFTVVRPSEISTTVPAGSTTGIVQVVTPGATLSSNVMFRVTP